MLRCSCLVYLDNTLQESIANELAGLENRCVLKLNFCYTMSHSSMFDPPDFWDKLFDFLQSQAVLFASYIPWVHTVSFMSRTRSEVMCWKTWSVQRAPGDMVRVDYQAAYDSLLPG